MYRLLLLSLAVVLVGCAKPHRDLSRSTTFSYQCEGEKQPIVVILNKDGGHLFARQANQSLRQKPGSRDYVGEGVYYRPLQAANLPAGRNAEITFGKRTPLICTNDPQAAAWEGAKLRGISYRAIGNDPSWVLEIDRDKGILLVTDNGATRHRYPYVKPVYDSPQKTSRYSAKVRDDKIAIAVTSEACSDSLSGEKLNSRVEITWREKTLRGCGRTLH